MDITKALETVSFQGFSLASPRGFEPPTPRLGVASIHNNDVKYDEEKMPEFALNKGNSGISW